MLRKFIVPVVILLTLVAAVSLSGRPAAALGPNVSITASTASNGTTTLTYRATATSSGTLRYIQVSIPAGSAGRITSINGTVSTVAPNVLRWTPSRTVSVAAGARFALPFYGLRLPSGGPWTLGFNAVSRTGAKISYGVGVLAATRAAYQPDVTITASNPIPGESTNLSYRGVITSSGALSKIVMELPPGATGRLTTINGTLSASSGLATWTPASPISVAAGARLAIPIYGVTLSRFGGIKTLTMSARTSTGAILMSGSGTLALIAPPADMPEVAVPPLPTVPEGCPTSWPSVAQENAVPGTADWVIPETMNGNLAAYLTRVSATCGDAVDLKVTSGQPVDVVAYRMGYYGGLGAREVWRADDVPTILQDPPVTGGTDEQGHPLRMTTAKHWATTLTIPVTAAWVPGTYLVKVSDGTVATYAPITVRDDTGTKHDLLIQQATTTWSSYNSYGGVSFYTGLNEGSGRLSFDRPYDQGQGSGQFLLLEQGLVFWAESKGLDVTYWTANDLHALGGQLPDRATTVFLPAHDEYYSLEMRAALSQAIERGVNVANLGANTVFRRIQFTDATLREWDIDRYTAGFDSTQWRYLGDAYASQPLLGAEYVCYLYGSSLTTGSSWLFDGIPAGTVIPGFIAGELDTVDPGLWRHPGLEIIASGTGICRNSGKAAPMHATTFTAPSGARVLNGSTWAYGCFLVGRCPSDWTVSTPPETSRQITWTVVDNIAEWVSKGALAGPTTAAAAPQLAAKVPAMKVGVEND